MRVAFLACALVLAAFLTGCGQSGSAGSAASAVPEGALAYVSVDTSFEGDQWRAVAGLLEEFPDGEGLLEDLLDQATAEAGLEGGADVRDALGPEVALVVLAPPADPAAEPPVVVLTKPDDQDAYDALFEGQDAARGEIQGWQAVARTEADIEPYRTALEAGSIEGTPAFEEAMDDLPEDALVRLYVGGEALAETAAGLQPGISPLPLAIGEGAGSVGAALVAEGDGVRVEGRAVAADDTEAPELEPFEPELVEEVPAGAIAFLSFNDLGSALTAYGDSFESAGVQLPFDLDEVSSLLAGEIAFYVRPGPSFTLVAEVEDEEAARATVESLLGFAGPDASIVYDVSDGTLAVSSSQAELDALRGDGPRLDQDDRFEEALDAAGMPDETTGFVYVDVQAAVPLLSEGDPGSLPPARYLSPLGGLVFWGLDSGDVQEFSLFLGIG